MAKKIRNSGEINQLVSTVQQLVQLDRNGQQRLTEAEQKAQRLLDAVPEEIQRLEAQHHSRVEASLQARQEELREESERAILNAELRFSKAQQTLRDSYYRHSEAWIEELVKRVIATGEPD